uniref:DNA mismatch repair protein MSH2 n=1 Tax=Clastoptera arizonana TaxID=38151 RepID=A0A1B6C2N8_9HEMI
MAMKPATQMNMDITQQRMFVAYHKSLPEKPATTIRFFNRTDYYTVHGPDASLAAKEVFRTTSFIKTIGSGDEILDSVVLNKAQFESFVRDLLLFKQYRVEVYTKSIKSNNTWILEYKGSPGNLGQFEELLFCNNEQIEGSAVIGIKLGNDSKNKVIGVGLVDTIDHSFALCEFPDDDYFTNLEALVVQLGPKECIVPSETNHEFENIKKVMERSGVLLTSRKKADFNSDGIAQDLNRLIRFESGQQQNVNSLPQMDLKVACGCLGAVVKYLELCMDQDNFSQYNMKSLDHKRFVHLDVAAVQALSLLPPPGSQSIHHMKHNNVLGLLDKCRTPQGHRLLSQWVKQPLRDLLSISDRHDVVEVLVQDTELRQSLYEEHLRKIPDLQALSKKLQRKKANMQDCYRIYQAMLRLPNLIEALKSSDHPTFQGMFIKPILEHLSDMAKFQEMVETTLDMELVDKGEFLIKPEFDEELQGLREKMNGLEEDIKRQLNKAARDLNLEPGKSLKLESNAQLGYFFRITLKDEKCLRNQSDYKQLDAKSNGVRFRNSKLSQYNDDYLEARDEYSNHQKHVVSEVVAIAAGYANTLKILSYLLAQLDVLTSFALTSVSAPIPYVRPVMKTPESRIFSLKQARHPCVEMQDSVSYIANDVHFEEDNCSFLMVTGPNMGGKSTYIRSAGVVALLAHIGCFVPCESAEISLVDAILARVGASDSQVRGLSTFMVEMVETAAILRRTTINSLVIIDELGRGTSTYEGCGIAWAIAEHLAKDVKCFTLFATHFHELTRLSETIPTLKNQHVTAITSDNSLTLMYQVKPGACDQSFGIHVAKMARFPSHVVEDAKRKLEELEDYQSLIIDEDDAKKRKIIQDGEKTMEVILAELKLLPVEKMDDQQLEEAFNKLKDKALTGNNAYISALLG